MRLPTILAFALFAVTQAKLPLLEALRTHANAKNFADFLEDNPRILEFYEDSAKTVFAPSDAHFGDDLSGLRRRQNPSATGAYQCSTLQFDMQAQAPLSKASTNSNSTSFNSTYIPTPLSGGRGSVVYTGLKAPQLGGQPQVVVSISYPKTNTTSNLRERRTDSGTVPSSDIRLFSGLGSNVSIIKGDIPYDGGLIHSVNG
jgi:hypothetical protein